MNKPYQPARRWCVVSRHPTILRHHCTKTGAWLTGPLTTSEAVEECARLGLAAGSTQAVLGAAILELGTGPKMATGSMLAEDGARLKERANRHGGTK